MRPSLFVVLLLLVASAGCLGGPSQVSEWVVTDRCGSQSAAEMDVNDTASESLSSNATTEERALCAEELYLEHQFRNASCVDSWDTHGIVVEEETSIVNETGDGTYVDVRHPYVWGNEDVSDDGFSEAIYLVTADRIVRVRGDTVTPCQRSYS